MYYTEETRYVLRKRTYGIMVLKEPEAWEVYYVLPHCAWTFAFGLPLEETLEQVMFLAERNFDIYASIIFEEEE